jgi:hypothetical protein
MLSISLDCIFLIVPLVFSNVYLSCVLCTLCCQLLLIVYFWLPLWYSLKFICPVSCVPYAASFPGLYIFDCPFGILWNLFVLCLVYPMLPVSLDCLFWLSLWCSLTFFCPVSYLSSVQDTGQIKVREYQRGNHKWTIQRIWQHRVHKTQDK